MVAPTSTLSEDSERLSSGSDDGYSPAMAQENSALTGRLDSTIAVLCIVYGAILGVPAVLASLVILVSGTLVAGFVGAQGGALVLLLGLAVVAVAGSAIGLSIGGFGMLMQKSWARSTVYSTSVLLIVCIFGACIVNACSVATGLPPREFTFLNVAMIFLPRLAIGVITAFVPMFAVWRLNEQPSWESPS